ncbi:MAG TPA: hypothetical protein VN493_26010 [Thermoanaerobaculia bacterium]|nr:hypothetical protein [Thermoanaerobaculia bacterium]
MDNETPIELAQLKPRRPWYDRIFLNRLRRELAEPEVEFPPPPYIPSSEGETPPVSLAIDFGTSAVAVALVGSQPFPQLFSFRVHDQTRSFFEAAVGRKRDRGHSSLVDNYSLAPIYVPSMRSGWVYDVCLKRRIEWLARTWVGGSWKDNAVLDVAAVTSHILHRAWEGQDRETLRRQIQGPIYVSIPNTFPRDGAEAIEQGVACGVAAMLRLDRLPAVKTLLEAEAVAHSVLSRYGQSAKPRMLLVIDAGAGTTDASIVRSEENGLRVIAHTGLPVGGLDLDALIAQQGEGFESMEPKKIEGNLRTARELKLMHWNGSNGGAGSLADRFALGTEQIAEALPKELNTDKKKLIDDLTAGYRRYLGLAIHALLDCFRLEELRQVDRVVLSGRASLLLGFEEEVQSALAARGVQDAQKKVEGAGSGDDRKLAVLRGVAAYAGVAQSTTNRQPLRAGYELVLRRAIGRETRLLPIGAQLIHGWGVASWSMNPLLEPGEWPIHVRTLPHKVIGDLIENGFFNESDRELLVGWSSRPVLMIRGNPPFTDCCAFDFLTQKALSRRKKRVEQAGGEPLPSQHPVHYAQENWFERFLGDSA